MKKLLIIVFAFIYVSAYGQTDNYLISIEAIFLPDFYSYNYKLENGKLAVYKSGYKKSSKILPFSYREKRAEKLEAKNKTPKRIKKRIYSKSLKKSDEVEIINYLANSIFFTLDSSYSKPALDGTKLTVLIVYKNKNHSVTLDNYSHPETDKLFKLINKLIKDGKTPDLPTKR